MSLQFRCPECQESVQVSEALAGLHTRCPRCTAHIAVPDSSPAAYSPGTSPPPLSEPARGGGWQAAAPRYSNYERPLRHVGGAGWDTARHGLTMEFIGIIVVLCAVVGSILMQCITFGFLTSAMGSGQGMLTLLQGLLILIGIAILIGLVLILVGRSLCCAAPTAMGVKGLAIGSTVSFVLFALAGGLLVLVVGFSLNAPFRGGLHRGGADALAGVLAIGGGLLLVTSHVLFTIFLRNAAVSCGNHSLGTRAIVFLVFSLVLPLLWFLGMLFLQMMVVRVADPTAVLLFATVVQWVVALVLLGWYSSLVAQVRNTVSRARPTQGGDWGD